MLFTRLLVGVALCASVLAHSQGVEGQVQRFSQGSGNSQNPSRGGRSQGNSRVSEEQARAGLIAIFGLLNSNSTRRTGQGGPRRSRTSSASLLQPSQPAAQNGSIAIQPEPTAQATSTFVQPEPAAEVSSAAIAVEPSNTAAMLNTDDIVSTVYASSIPSAARTIPIATSSEEVATVRLTRTLARTITTDLLPESTPGTGQAMDIPAQLVQAQAVPSNQPGQPIPLQPSQGVPNFASTLTVSVAAGSSFTTSIVTSSIPSSGPPAMGAQRPAVVTINVAGSPLPSAQLGLPSNASYPSAEAGAASPTQAPTISINVASSPNSGLQLQAVSTSALEASITSSPGDTFDLSATAFALRANGSSTTAPVMATTNAAARKSGIMGFVATGVISAVMLVLL